MTVAGRYLTGLAAVGAGGVVAGFLAGPSRIAVWIAAAVALTLQGPLGWWLIRSIGRPGFLRVWGLGLLGRFGLLGVAGAVLLVSMKAHTEAVLITLAGALVALLGVEVVVLLGDSPKREDM
jgi:hypothetical protein